MASGDIAGAEHTLQLNEQDEQKRSITVIKLALIEFIGTIRARMNTSLAPIVTQEERKRIFRVLEETEYMIACDNEDEHGASVYGDKLVKLKRLFYPLERRLSERHLAMRNFEQTIESMGLWITMYREDKSIRERLTIDKLIRLGRLLHEYDSWYQQQLEKDYSQPEDFALKTAQLIAHNQALEVAWITILEDTESDLSSGEDLRDVEDETTQVNNQASVDELEEAWHSMNVYIAEMVGKLQGPLNAFVSRWEQQEFLSLFHEAKSWLYSEGSSASYEDFEERMIILENIGLLIEQRLFERVELVKQFKYYIEQYRRVLDFLRAGDPFYVRLDPAQTEYLRTALDQYEHWLRDQQLAQQRLQALCEFDESDPQLSTQRIAEQLQKLQEFWNSLVNVRVSRPCSPFHNYDNTPYYEHNRWEQSKERGQTITIRLSNQHSPECGTWATRDY